MYDDRAVYVFMYFDMFYIQWHHLVKTDLWNKVYMNERTYVTLLKSRLVVNYSVVLELKKLITRLNCYKLLYYLRFW
jgi:hypothetical protein